MIPPDSLRPAMEGSSAFFFLNLLSFRILDSSERTCYRLSVYQRHSAFVSVSQILNLSAHWPISCLPQLGTLLGRLGISYWNFSCSSADGSRPIQGRCACGDRRKCVVCIMILNSVLKIAFNSHRLLRRSPLPARCSDH
jgi:hypothetical protein